MPKPWNCSFCAPDTKVELVLNSFSRDTALSSKGGLFHSSHVVQEEILHTYLSALWPIQSRIWHNTKERFMTYSPIPLFKLPLHSWISPVLRGYCSCRACCSKQGPRIVSCPAAARVSFYAWGPIHLQLVVLTSETSRDVRPFKLPIPSAGQVLWHWIYG